MCFLQDKSAIKSNAYTWLGKTLIIQNRWYNKVYSCVEKIEESLIVKYVPLLNLDKNPVKLSELVELRRKCKAVANGY